MLTGSNMGPEIGVSMKYKEIYNSVNTVYDTEIYDRFVLLAQQFLPDSLISEFEGFQDFK